MTVENVIYEIIKICKTYNAQEVILFGSRAKGTFTDRSDIDIAVSGIVDFDNFEEQVFCIPTLYKVDIVNLDKCKNNLLLEDIKQYGQKIL